MGRSRSGSASSGSSDGGGYKQHKNKGSDDGHGDKKEKKDKKDKKDKKEDKDKKDKKDKKNEFEIPGLGKLPGPAGAILGALSPALASLASGGSGHREVPGSSQHQPVGPGQQPLMPAYAQASHQSSHAPGKLDPNQIPQWARILHTGYDLPPPNEVGFAACSDIGGEPLFLVLVPMGGGIHPAKMVIRPGSSRGEVYVSYGGNEVSYDGEFALVPFDPDRMQWVRSPGGCLPHGPRPVDAGREAEGQPLYHALGLVNGGRVPGKAAPHLGGASVAFGGDEVGSADCEILCWK